MAKEKWELVEEKCDRQAKRIRAETCPLCSSPVIIKGSMASCRVCPFVTEVELWHPDQGHCKVKK